MQHRGSDPAHAGWTRAYDYVETSLIEDGGGGAPLKTNNRLSRTAPNPNGAKRRYCGRMDRSPVSLVEFPADDPQRALRFWQGVLNVEFEARKGGEGEGWQTRSDAAEIGVHKRGTGPGDTFSLPYLIVDDMAGTLQRVIELDGTVVHPGDHFAICKDSEGSPFGLMAKPH